MGVRRLARATFLCIFRHDGIFDPACWGGWCTSTTFYLFYLFHPSYPPLPPPPQQNYRETATCILTYCSNRVLTPLPKKTQVRQVEIIWTNKITPPPYWDRRAQNHINFMSSSAFLRRCELPLYTKVLIWTNSVGPLGNSLLWDCPSPLLSRLFILKLPASTTIPCLSQG